MSDRTLEYFVSEGKIEERDAADVLWSHAANSRAKIAAALTGALSSVGLIMWAMKVFFCLVTIAAAAPHSLTFQVLPT